MTISTPYNCYLEVKEGGKGIPYGAGPRPDGSHNYGFRSLKGIPEAVSEIPEVQDDPALAAFLRAVNENSTAFFTVGCVSGKVEDDSGHRMSGYVEVCVNDRLLVGDAVNYFKVFWRFTECMRTNQFAENVTLHWEIIGATFLDAGCGGMTCRIEINTHYASDAVAAYECWTKTLSILASTLTEYKNVQLDRIY